MEKLAESLPAIIGAAAQSPLGMLALLSLALSILAYFFFSGASEKVRIGIFVLLFLAVVGLGSALFKAVSKGQDASVTGSHPPLSTTSLSEPITPESGKAPQRIADNQWQTQAGHYLFKLLGTELAIYSTGKHGNPEKYSLRVSIRVTDILGTADYVDGNTIRLSADGSLLSPENTINFAVYERQAVETEAVFIVPADAKAVELVLGRPQDGTSTLPLSLHLGER